MKTKFFALVALVLGMASCTKDFAPETNVGGGEVDFTLRVSAPELATTRAGENVEDDGINGHNSAYGAIDYLSAEDWSNADLRYILEVYDYDATGEYNGATPIKDRQVQIVGEYAPVTFDLRLVQGRKYHFVVFADFVPQGASADLFDANYNDLQAKLGKHHIIGETLADIKVKKSKEDGINNEFTDAYFGSVDYTPENKTHNTADPIVLTRPYAKVRVVATDLHELNINVEPKHVEVKYYSSYPTAFNALNGNIAVEQREVTEQSEVIFTDDYNEGVSKENLSNHYYNEGYDKDYWKENDEGVKRHTHMTLFTDYILAKDTQESVQFTMTVRDANNGIIKSTDFLTEIPVQRNHLTTIIGNVLTTATDVKVSINDNFENEVQQDPSLERILLETLINGGKFTLTEDLTLTAPHYLEGTVECNADAVIDLNGYTLRYVIPSDVTPDVANKYAIFVRVMDNASLTFVGEGKVVSDGYIASVNDGGVLNISEGYFETTSCTVFQSNGGEINITGGEFKAAPYNGDHRYTINFIDTKKQEGLIEITGGRFYKYNPSESNSEVPAMDFCANGYWGVEDGDWYEVVAKTHYNLFVDHAEVYTAEGLLQWAYIVNNGATSELQALDGFNAETFNKNSYGLEVKANIKLRMFTIEADATTETYVYTTTPITISTDGKPSGSNWATVGSSKDDILFDCEIHGNNHKISNLTVCGDRSYVGFIGLCENAEVADFTFENVTLYGTGNFTSIIGYVDDGGYVRNVHTTNSKIYGNVGVAAIAGSATDHYDQIKNVNAVETGLMGAVAAGKRQRRMPIVTVENCSVDGNTTVTSKGGYAGGILGQAYGCIVRNCHSKADVFSGGQHTGGVAGYARDYHYGEYLYIVNCSSTNCTIKGTTYVGGVCGYLMEGHDGSAYVVGCYTNADVVANANTTSKGAIVGYNNGDNMVLGCYANSSLKAVGYHASSFSTPYSFVYANGGMTEEDKAVMNDGIAIYNAFAANYKFSVADHSDRKAYTPADCIYNVSLPQATLW